MEKIWHYIHIRYLIFIFFSDHIFQPVQFSKFLCIFSFLFVIELIRQNLLQSNKVTTVWSSSFSSPFASHSDTNMHDWMDKSSLVDIFLFIWKIKKFPHHFKVINSSLKWKTQRQNELIWDKPLKNRERRGLWSYNK